jgi:Mn-dependent DtxR family transcriptional regulator
LWALMAKHGDSAMKVVDLASELKVDPALLARFMRHLAAMGYLAEVDSDEYKSTNFTKALSLQAIGDGYPAM